MNINDKYYPKIGMKNLVFETKDGVLHKGKYDVVPVYNCRRWIDDNGNIYQSHVDVINWWLGSDSEEDLYGSKYFNTNFTGLTNYDWLHTLSLKNLAYWLECVTNDASLYIHEEPYEWEKWLNEESR